MNATKNVTACPYIKNTALWHVDMTYTDPHTSKEVRKRRVAPAGLTLEGAIAWGQNERLRIVTDLARPVANDDEIEGEAEPKKTKAQTLAEVWPEFETGHISKQKLNTRLSYIHARRYILGALGDLRLDQVDGAALEALKDALASLGVASQKIYMAKLAKLMKWAMSKSKIPRAILPKVEFDAVKKKRVEIYSPEDLERMLELAGDSYERVLLLLLTDGCLRIGETAGLMWMDINFPKGKHGTMAIVRNVAQGHLQDTAKGEDGSVPLTPRLASALRKLQGEGQHSVWVLPRRSKNRKPSARAKNPRVVAEHSNETHLSTIVLRLERDAKLDPHGPHRIRHSRLTHLAERGVSLRALQHLARHASETTTEKYYLHVNKLGLAAAAVDEIENMTTPPPSCGNGAEAKRKRPQIALVV